MFLQLIVLSNHYIYTVVLCYNILSTHFIILLLYVHRDYIINKVIQVFSLSFNFYLAFEILVEIMEYLSFKDFKRDEGSERWMSHLGEKW